MAALTDGQRDQLREQLLNLREEITRLLALSDASAATVTLDQTKVGRLSRMDALQQQAMARANRAGYRRRLTQVEAALKAFAAGDYGYCEACGETIPYARLQIRPESDLCVTCQAADEQDD
ncbi:TraR/DksA family transcriptional regulator [Exilibacterium tricleocarpae]|uniref:TraR/DksA family transcriptional regulator n=1 Tax=Exilibacterium tricleocarpae TaxID=2591008 RepID=A0A545SRX8_9GAMM|nr:TraR/DksA family transcriptional regulator [Exilibacterium tricleocarpae]TQV67705.1 TraR/DksA family transcriptional regulator [Exilibacterium tricleocarpae]